MTLNGEDLDNLTITDANGLVLAVVADDECIAFGEVKLIENATYSEIYIDGKCYIKAHPCEEE